MFLPIRNTRQIHGLRKFERVAPGFALTAYSGGIQDSGIRSRNENPAPPP